MNDQKKPKKPLCIAPFIGMAWRGNRGFDESYEGFYKPCCDSRDSEDLSSKVKIQNVTSLDEVFNNPFAVEVRKKLAAGEFHEVCWRCKELQTQGLKSPPQKYDKIIDEKLDSVYWDVEKGNLENKLYLLDYRPSNLCNLKCRMCSSANSSLIAAEEDASPFLYNKERKASQIGEFLPFSDLKLLKLAGGEPMIMPETKTALEKIKDNPSAMVVILTNAAKLDEGIIERIKSLKIKRIHFQISVDGTEATYEYIRTGSRWPEFNKNLGVLGNLNCATEVTMGFTLVAQMWNAFNLANFVRWFVTINKNLKNDHHYYPKIHILRVLQDHLSLSLLDDSDKNTILEEVEEASKALSASDYNLLSAPLIEFIKEEATDRSLKLKTFLEITRHFESSRAKRLVDLEPRFSKYLD